MFSVFFFFFGRPCSVTQKFTFQERIFIFISSYQDEVLVMIMYNWREKKKVSDHQSGSDGRYFNGALP